MTNMTTTMPKESACTRCFSAGGTFKVAAISCCVLILFSVLNVSSLIASFIGNDVSREISDPQYRTLPLSEKIPTHRDTGSLPDFTNGGIVVFYHIYKTGGSTIGKLLHELARDDQIATEGKQHGPSVLHAQKSKARLFFTMIRKHVDWTIDCVPLLNLAVSKKKLVLLELHVEYPSTDFPSLVELAPTLELWRAEANRRGVGFFAFTMVREPVAHALSFFNFFHVGHNENRPLPTETDHDHWNPFKPLVSTEKNFLLSYYANNRQCRMLSSDPESTRGAPGSLVWEKSDISRHEYKALRQPCQIDKVHDVFFDTMDWVGTTEKLQNETLPLLTQLVVNDPTIGHENKPFKVFDNHPLARGRQKGMKKQDLTDKTKSIILERTKLDRGLYEKVVRDFKLTDLGWNYESPG